MRYTWDPGKNRRNVAKHGIAFEDAIRIFDSLTFEKEDDRFDYAEVRIYAIGIVNGVVMTVIYTDREPDVRRIIAAWRAEPHEQRAYWRSVRQ